MSAGSLVRIWREASSTIAPTIANESCGEASRSTSRASASARLASSMHSATRVERGVAALGGARAGADDLHQQRLRLVREGVDDLEEGAHRRADAALGVSPPCVDGGLRDRLA